MTQRINGTIGLITNEAGRFTRFWNSMLALQMPPGIKIISKIGCDLAKMRNEVLKDMEGDWVWCPDDDHTFEPDLLLKLIAHNVDMVQPLCLKKYAPFGPIHMGPQVEGTQAHWQHALLPDDPRGLKEVHVVGASCSLIRRHVIDAIPFPWYEIGRIEPDGLGEDIWFSRKVRAAGFKIFCDLANPITHLNVGSVYAHRKEDGSWSTVLEFGAQKFEFPTAVPKFRVHPDGHTEPL